MRAAQRQSWMNHKTHDEFQTAHARRLQHDASSQTGNRQHTDSGPRDMRRRIGKLVLDLGLQVHGLLTT